MLGVLLGPASAFAKKTTTWERATEKRLPAKSVGPPNDGHLVGGHELEASDTVRVYGKHRWGLPDLVGLIERSAARVNDAHAGSILMVGDLSHEDGGQIVGHDSHETGRDVDLGFFLTRAGKPLVTSKLYLIDREGRANGRPDVRFDEARNWALVEALLSDRSASVLQIFVANHLRARLLAEGKRAGAPASVLARAGDVLVQPRRGQRHDDHFHVRIRCPKGQTQCVNFPLKSWSKVTKALRPKKPPRKSR